jgi:signal transduction histidine kinase
MLLPLRRRAHPRDPRRSRSRAIVALLLLTLGMAGVLAFEAQQAARSHRAVAEGVLRDYAAFAQWELTRLARRALVDALQSRLQRLGCAMQSQGLHAVLASSTGTGCASQIDDNVRTVFRMDATTGAIEQAGAALTAPMIATLGEAVEDAQRSPERHDCPMLRVYPGASGPELLVWRVHWDRGRAPDAHGFRADASLLKALFARLLDESPLLPPSLGGGTPTKDVLSVRVAGPEGHALFGSSTDWSEYAGESTLEESLGGLRLAVALRPDAARRLIIGGLPRERLPLLVGLLALSAALIVVALVQLRRESELARLRSDFVSGVSHELRTPLAQIRMFTETLLLGRVRSAEEGRRSLEIVHQETQRLTHLVENVLYFSRSERHVTGLARTRTRLDRFVAEVAESFEPLARSRRAAIVVGADARLEAEIDPSAMRQVLLNLLDNAVKYGPEGQTVRVSVTPDAGWTRISVADEGPGIAEADAQRIWDPFCRLDRAVAAGVGGSGIGLAIVRQIVELHGGQATVERVPGGGARFVIRLPIVEGEPDADPVPPLPQSDLAAPLRPAGAAGAGPHA